jgi:hypothetical protein
MHTSTASSICLRPPSTGTTNDSNGWLGVRTDGRDLSLLTADCCCCGMSARARSTVALMARSAMPHASTSSDTCTNFSSCAPTRLLTSATMSVSALSLRVPASSPAPTRNASLPIDVAVSTDDDDDFIAFTVCPNSSNSYIGLR